MSARRGNTVDQFTGTARMSLYILNLLTFYFTGLLINFQIVSSEVSWKDPCIIGVIYK